jgi:hypothetical protein
VTDVRMSCPVDVLDLAEAFGVTNPAITGTIAVELFNPADAIAQWTPDMHMLGNERAVRFTACVRHDATKEQRTRFVEWAKQRFERLMEHGPRPDGWRACSDGSLQMWAREVAIPALD